MVDHSILEEKEVKVRYTEIIKDIYNGVSTLVRTMTEKTCELSITIDLHQGSALRPNLFALVMDKLTSHLQDDIPWCMLFVDYLSLIDETNNEVNVKLKKCGEDLEVKMERLERISIIE